MGNIIVIVRGEPSVSKPNMEKDYLPSGKYSAE